MRRLVPEVGQGAVGAPGQPGDDEPAGQGRRREGGKQEGHQWLVPWPATAPVAARRPGPATAGRRSRGETVGEWVSALCRPDRAMNC